MTEKISGYLIEKYNNMTGAYTCNRLVEEALAREIELQLVGIYDSCVMNGVLLNRGKKLEKRDFAINRYKGGAVSQSFTAVVDRRYNPQEPFLRYLNKYNQMADLAGICCGMPRYLLATANAGYAWVVEQLGEPFVMKGLESSQGQEVFLIQNREEYRKLAEQFGAQKEWLFEEFIAESVGRDMRCFCLRGKVIAAMIREARSGFRANVALGASVSAFEADDTIRRAAAEIYERTGLDFVGLDLLFGKEKPYFCEINVMPGIEGMERATGVNVAGAVMELIREDYRIEIC